ncbi:MAG: TIGR02281 family clan AA aspartic protease [Sulfitobacter sp.]|nr:TIGR02281 family clan AA aspartic protease [Sulfitobacter sp.]
MTDIDTSQLIYLVLLGAMVAGWFFMQTRQGLNRTMQYAAVWGMIFVGGAAAVGLWQDISRDAGRPMLTQTGDGAIVVPRSRDGHYHLTLDVNETPVSFVLDTGASQMVLTKADAQRAGIDPDSLDYLGRANTANGEVRTAFVRLDEVSLGGVVDRNVPAVVNEGEMRQSLLGMGYLERWGSIQIAQGELILRR